MTSLNGWTSSEWELFLSLRSKANQHNRDEATRLMRLDTERIAKHRIRQAYYEAQK